MSSIRKLRLPNSLQQNSVFSKICAYAEQSSTLFSSIYWKQSANKRYLIRKQPNCPYIQYDWTMYCILRSWARTLLISGETLRSQKNLLQNLSTQGNSDIQQLYTLNRQQKQNVVIYTRTMNEAEIRSYVNEDYYNVICVKDLLGQKTQTNTDIFELLNKLVECEYGPILLQMGTKSMREIFQKTDAIDLAIVTDYDGPLPENCKGDQSTYSLQLQEIWSEKVDAGVSHGSQGQQDETASLKFTVYGSKRLLKLL